MTYSIHYSYRNTETGEENSDALGFESASAEELWQVIKDIRADKVGAYSDDFRKNACLYVMNENYNLV